MSHSNHTSFMTANDQGASPRNSATHHHNNQQQSQFKQQRSGSLYRTQSGLYRNESVRSKHTTHSERPSAHHSTSEELSNEHSMSSSGSSAYSSDGLESSHTITDDSTTDVDDYNEKKQRDDMNAEGHPASRITTGRSTTRTGVLRPELKTYPIAWLYLLFLVLLRASVAIFGNTFSPIPTVTADYMGITLSSINWIYNTMSICYIAASFFTSYLYQLVGVKWSLVLSGCILSFGCWVRWIAVRISPPSFPILMIGQTIASFSSPISLNIQTMFASLWFTENKRATAGMFIVSNYGAIIAMFLMPAIATGKDKIELTAVVVASLATAATIPFVFLPAKPPTPASYEDDIKVPESEITLRRGAIMLIKNPHFLTLAIVHGLNVGLSIAWNGLMNQAITPYGYSNTDVGNIAAIGVVGGTLGCLIAGPVIDKTKQSTILLKIMTPLMFSTYVALIFVVKAESFAAILYTNALQQFFLSFMVPVCIELGVEITYPVPNSLATSILWQVSQLIGFVLVIIMDLFRDTNGVPKNNLYKALIFQAAIAGVCSLSSLVFNGPMLRTKALKEQEELRMAEEMGLNQTTGANHISKYPSHHFFDSNETLQALGQDEEEGASEIKYQKSYHSSKHGEMA